jgi:hypothetical protein
VSVWSVIQNIILLFFVWYVACHTGDLTTGLPPLSLVSVTCDFFLKNLVKLSPDDVLTFYIEDMSNSVKSSTAISCSSAVDDSLIIFEVTMNWPYCQTISPSTGLLPMNKVCIITVELGK